MTYSDGYPIRLIGGRLALDFVNTADWSVDAKVVHEKIVGPSDVNIWLDALNLEDLSIPEGVSDLLAFRFDLRQILLGNGPITPLSAARDMNFATEPNNPAAIGPQPLKSVIAISALSILTDKREFDRLKLCPGDDCGWLFIDETKNARRRWCSMETCGNRAKAARHYARSKSNG